MNCFPRLLARQIELVRRLEIHPEISRHAEVPAEPQRGVRGDAPLSREELIEAVRRHLDNVGEFLGSEAGFFQLISENFTGVDGYASHEFSSLLLVIVYDLDVRRSVRILRPLKTNAPLFINPNRILTLAVSLQGFQAIGVQCGKIS
jgi:hypothetical protein